MSSANSHIEIQAMRQHVIEGGSVAGGTFNTWRQVERGTTKPSRRKRVQDLFEQAIDASVD